MIAMAMRCIEDFYARMFRDWPDADTRYAAAYTLAYSGSRILTGANHLFPRAQDAITPDALDAASQFFAQFGAAWSVIHAEPFTAHASALLTERQFYARWQSPLYALDQPPKALPVNRIARVIRAHNETHLRDARSIMTEAFMTDVTVSHRVARAEHLGDPNVHHYVVYDDSQPVCCATVTICGALASIWNVGTRRDFRHRRYATTLMRALLDDLRARNITTTVLMATASGQPLYENLGYRLLGNVAYLAPPRGLRAIIV